MKFRIVILALMFVHRLNAQSGLPIESFLKSISEHRVIGLGEKSHGVETYNDVKSSLLSAGVRNHPNSNLLVESSFNLSMVHFLEQGDMTNWGENVLFQFWNTDSVLNSMKHFNLRSQTLKRPALAGFDMSEDCRFEVTSFYLIKSGWLVQSVIELRLADSIMSQCMAPHAIKNRLSSQERIALSALYDKMEKEVMRFDSSMKRDIVIRMIENRKALCTFLSIANKENYFAYRDSMMADNVFWLIDHFCKDEKVFLWAANVHLAATDIGPDQSAYMGELIHKRFNDAYYNVDLVRSRFGRSYVWLELEGKRRRSSSVLKVKKVKMLIYGNTCYE